MSKAELSWAERLHCVSLALGVVHYYAKRGTPDSDVVVYEAMDAWKCDVSVLYHLVESDNLRALIITPLMRLDLASASVEAVAAVTFVLSDWATYPYPSEARLQTWTDKYFDADIGRLGMPPADSLGV